MHVHTDTAKGKELTRLEADIAETKHDTVAFLVLFPVCRDQQWPP